MEFHQTEYCNSKHGFSSLALTLFSFFTPVPVQRNCAVWGGEAPFVQRRGNYSYTHASHEGKLAFGCETLSSVTPTSGLKSPNSWPGGGADAEEGQEENPQQEVCSRESQEKEGLCWWTGEQVREDAHTVVKRISYQYIRTSSRKCLFILSSWDFPVFSVMDRNKNASKTQIRFGLFC